jgi:Outer membrane protein beta-barrel domain
MTAFRFVSMVPCVVLMTATIAAAQQVRPASSAPLDNGYMTGAAGASFGDTQSVTFGIEIGERIGSRVQAYVAFHYFDDLFNDQAVSDLNELSSYLTTVTGDTWALQGRDRGLAFSGGARYLLSRGPSFRPYIGGGPGVLNIQRTITERTLGNVSDPVLVVFGAPDGFVNAEEESTFRPMAEFIAGVGIASGRTYVDVGYRFRKVFNVESFTFSQFTVGVGMRF